MPGSGGSSTQNGTSSQQTSQQMAGQTSQNRDPWAPAQPHLQSIMSEAARAYGREGSSVADMDIRTRQGISDASLIAGGPNVPLGQLAESMRGIQGVGDRAAGQTYAERYVPGIMGNISGPSAADQYLTGVASGENAGQNPHLAAMLDVNASRIGNRVNSAMSGAGRYGSFAHGDQLATRINETNLPILSQSYENDRARQLQATGMIDSARQAQAGIGLSGAGLLDSSRRGADQQAFAANTTNAGLAPLYNQLQYAPSQMMMNLGGQVQGQNQRVMDSPWQDLSRYGGAVSGLSGLLQGMGTSQGTSSGTQSGTQFGTTSQEREDTMGWQDMLRFGSNVGSMALPFLSDRNEKTDIKKIGTSEETGLDIYSYRYKGDSKSYPKVVGPMAQQIEEKYPGSTGMLDGKMYVKPHAAGLLGAI